MVFPIKNQNGQDLLESHGIPATDCMIESILLSESLAQDISTVARLPVSGNKLNLRKTLTGQQNG